MNFLSSGVDFLLSHNFNVITGKNIARRCDYLAGSDEERADDLNAMLRDSRVRAIMLARGGYGGMRILERIDLEALAYDPKIICGMSDATAIQLFVFRKLNLVTFSGPMIAGQVGRGLDNWTRESFLNGLCEPWDGVELFGDRRIRIRVLIPGCNKGPLLGGCLSIVSALVGTPCLPDLSGAILLLEDVGEPLYRLDRMFTQLRLAGIYDLIGGMVLGYFIGPDGTDQAADVDDLVAETTQGYDFPIVSAFPHGHRLPNVMFPHGMEARLDTSLPSLKFVG